MPTPDSRTDERQHPISASPLATNSAPSHRPHLSRQSRVSKFTECLDWRDPLHSAQRILTEPEGFQLVAACLLVFEAFLMIVILRNVPYTEIDFSTYLQQARIFLAGERDYALIKGDTGPCVYPAGHLYAYTLLNYVTDGGQYLERAQWFFAGIYVATLALVFRICQQSKRIPPYALVFLTLSKRVHSLYVLRLFNDCLSMFFLYCALSCYVEGNRPNSAGSNRSARWIIGTCFFSLALSIKMSILLFLPALLYLLFVYHSPVALLQHVVLLVSTQTLLASPFLTSRSLAESYVSGAFDFKRVFLWEWTVNWRWLGVEVFENPAWGKVLLMVHAAGLGVMAIGWSTDEGGVFALLRRACKMPNSSPARYSLTASRTISIFFTSNLLGILCARSLHYQFYVWFYHSLVWLIWETWDGLGIEVMQKLVFLSLVEFGFHSFPSTVNSSLGLVLSLLIILAVGSYGRPAGDRGPPVTSIARKTD